MKKCKECKDPFEPRFSTLERYCWKHECKFTEATQNVEQKKKTESKEWSQRKSKMKKDLLTVQDYLKMAQQVFNAFIRKRDDGLNCISCSNPAKKANAGHYFNANNHWNVRFDERNVHLQCEYCNTYLHGNLLEYQNNLRKKIGTPNYVLLCQDAYKTRKFTRDELKEIIIIYKNKLKE